MQFKWKRSFDNAWVRKAWNSAFTCNLNGKDLLTKLEHEKHEIQCLPAILYKSSGLFDVRNYNVPDYEILIWEPSHDICNHIKNLYDELQRHLPENEKVKLNEIITTSFYLKEAKNLSDSRKSLWKVSNWLFKTFLNIISQSPFQLLQRFKK